ncbi:uncharacterized protein LOC131246929 [Magnolia sinica]|uniref:uncharacterized protein LOC131246929 n=1 Tax=Magnolia sinica TaxID=86752 RepID=UPI00265A9AB7|nr:uncharacterized protein LOC131246929 [Magnolia sinica]
MEEVTEGRIWILAKQGIQVQSVSASRQCVSCLVTIDNISPFMLSVVYASCNKDHRKVLWDELRRISSIVPGPWMVCGDFNTTVPIEERLGGVTSFTEATRDFIEAINDSCLIDAVFNGSTFTWCNNRSGRSRRWARLYRMLLNGSWLSSLPMFTINHLTRSCSDHSPILLRFKDNSANFPQPFRFQRIWTTHDDFKRVVREAWDAEVVAAPMFKVFIKMKHLKRKLKDWNKTVFRDVHNNVQNAEDEIARAESNLIHSNYTDNLEKLQIAHENLKRALLQQELFWKQKSRIRWLQEGDRNTKFFHKSVMEKRQKQVIDKIRSLMGEILEKCKDIGREAEDYFKDLFSSQHRAANATILSFIPMVVTEQMNSDLMRPVTLEEVWQRRFPSRSIVLLGRMGSVELSSHLVGTSSEMMFLK